MFLAALTLCLAPTPRPLERLEPHHLVGRWDCTWGTSAAWFQFHDGGEYLYGSGDDPTYVGRWELRGGELWLTERNVNGWNWTDYTVCGLCVKGYPTITGSVSAAVPFAFSLRNPRRFPD